jgi:maltose O-acetyltransferase
MSGAASEASSNPGVQPGTGRAWRIRLAVVRCLMGIFPSFTLNRTRMLALKACGLRAGRGSLFWGMPRFTGGGSPASQLRIGSYCGFNEGCEFELKAPITIGDNVSVGHEVRFLTGRWQEGVQTAAPITIGDGVWLGARCTIQAGVSVGAGTVVGAGMTVATDVPPNTLMSGAKPISLAKWR